MFAQSLFSFLLNRYVADAVFCTVSKEYCLFDFIFSFSFSFFFFLTSQQGMQTYCKKILGLSVLLHWFLVCTCSCPIFIQ